VAGSTSSAKANPRPVGMIGAGQPRDVRHDLVGDRHRLAAPLGQVPPVHYH